MSEKTNEYVGLRLEDVKIPDQAEKIARKQEKWSAEPASGIKVMIWYAKNKSPFYIHHYDKTDGFKYGVGIDYTHYYSTMPDINKKLAELHPASKEKGMVWFYQLASYVDKDEVLAGLDSQIYTSIGIGHLFVWVTEKNKKHFPRLLAVISEAIREAAKLTFPDAVAAEKNQGIMKDEYYAVANSILPEELAVGFGKALKKLEAENSKKAEMGVIVDVEQSALLFTLGGFEEDNLRNKKAFYTYQCPTIKKCDDWCTELGLKNSQEACHWLTDALSIVGEDGAFDGFDELSIYGSYMFSDAGDMDVIYEKY